MYYHDPSVKAEIDAILSDKELRSFKNEQEFMVALRTLLLKLYKRGYSKEALCMIYKDVSYRRLKLWLEYHQESTKDVYLEGETEEQRKSKDRIVFTLT